MVRERAKLTTQNVNLTSLWLELWQQLVLSPGYILKLKLILKLQLATLICNFYQSEISAKVDIPLLPKEQLHTLGVKILTNMKMQTEIKHINLVSHTVWYLKFILLHVVQ